MPEVLTLELIVVVVIAVFIYGFSKTAMPVAGVVAGPLIAASLGPAIGSGFVVPLLILGDLMGLALYRSHADWRLMRKLVPGVLAGFVFMTLLFKFVDMLIVGRILGLLILTSVCLEVWRLTHQVEVPEDHPGMENKLAIAFYGTLAGMTTMGANAGGAAMTLYLVKMRVSMLAFMGTSAWFFFILNLLKVPFVAGLHLLTLDSFLISARFAPAMIVGGLVGALVFRRMNPKVFTTVALTLSALAALWLIIMG